MRGARSGRGTTKTYSTMQDEANALRERFRIHSVRINKQSSLARLFSSLDTLNREWERNQARDIKSREDILWDAMDLGEVCVALSPLAGSPNERAILRTVASGTLGMFERGFSEAKNKLWELQLFRRAKEGGLDVRLEEPDIVWWTGSDRTGIACKRVYSLRNMEKRIQEAVYQIGDSTKYGFVAINADELIPSSACPLTGTLAETSEYLQVLNSRTMAFVERRCLRYFSSDRMSGIIVGSSCKVRTPQGPYLNSQWLTWTHPNLSVEHKRRVGEFKIVLERAAGND